MTFGSNEVFGRFQVVSGPPSGNDTPLADPSAGGRVDRATGTVGQAATGSESYRAASPGVVAAVQQAEGISAGDEVATNGSGQAVVASSGDTIVARALQSSTSGGLWIVFESQRVKP